MPESGIDPATVRFEVHADFALPNHAQTWQDCNQLNENLYIQLYKARRCAPDRRVGGDTLPRDFDFHTRHRRLINIQGSYARI